MSKWVSPVSLAVRILGTNPQSIHFQDSITDLNLPNGNDLTQYGRFILDDDLHIKAHEDQKTKHRYAFVFEKLLILVKSSSKIGDNGQYSFREAHNLGEYRVEVCHSRKTLGRDARLKYPLLLARKTQSTAFTLYMKSEAKLNNFLKALQEAMWVFWTPIARPILTAIQFTGKLSNRSDAETPTTNSK